MKNILLPTDFSENSWNAISYALQFFENDKCNFYLLHIQTIQTLATHEEPVILNQDYIDTIYIQPTKQKLRAQLKKLSELSPNKKNHNFFTIIEYTFFTEGIRKTIEEKQIDLIVMGTKGASGLEKIILGTNTADVLTKVKCDTLVIPENAKFVTPHEIAFPTDFSLSSNLHILQPITDILEQFNSELKIVHISKSKINLNKDQQENKELLEDYFNHYNHSIHYLTNKKVENAIQCFVESRSIDMVCMVAKNLNYFQQILFHSKVENISYHTDIPFLVLHEKN
ncbi:nucleotide-binding universal stress UspA family protein [Winogradskyella epiphytica]|uniref:Nucleotide-binding universal stress UspA family protein n=1 Tax=Winogradskyella epiphytica TaxID=262005 RepID=A0A2V4X524_9FLAO|nr:universal stress protein [Winogradskyella epiphytica]PYE80145.1 nucleotide-binding universal stress UspA family protein [Winogradskyella epiphytica]GGW71665.1 universal stress protein UspA [Winogradskyella epiphytica]